MDFQIRNGGKSLGWYLGVDDISNSYREPLSKYGSRILEITSANAPAAAAFCRFNQRAVPVLGYVAQFGVPSVDMGLPALFAWSVHKLLRMPPQSFSRELCDNLKEFTVVSPMPLDVYCALYCMPRETFHSLCTREVSNSTEHIFRPMWELGGSSSLQNTLMVSGNNFHTS